MPSFEKGAMLETMVEWLVEREREIFSLKQNSLRLGVSEFLRFVLLPAGSLEF